MYKTKTLQIVGDEVEKNCIVKIANDSIFTSTSSRNHANVLEETKIWHICTEDLGCNNL